MSRSIPYTVEPVMVTERKYQQLMIIDTRIEQAYAKLKKASCEDTVREIHGLIGFLYTIRNKLLGQEQC